MQATSFSCFSCIMYSIIFAVIMCHAKPHFHLQCIHAVRNYMLPNQSWNLLLTVLPLNRNQYEPHRSISILLSQVTTYFLILGLFKISHVKLQNCHGNIWCKVSQYSMRKSLKPKIIHISVLCHP